MEPAAGAAGAAPPAPQVPSAAAANAPVLLGERRCICLIDMDCFYAQCEELRRPELKGRPVGVQQKMLVITSNYAAREFGIKKGDSLAAVRRKCPEITICSGEDLSFYREVSYEASTAAASLRYGPVERLGLDELFVDLTAEVDRRLERLRSLAVRGESGAAGDWDALPLVLHGHIFSSASPERDETVLTHSGDLLRGLDALGAQQRCLLRLAVASRLALDLRQRILSRVGVTTSAGVSVSKLLSKLVASHRKPNKMTVLVPHRRALEQLLPAATPVSRLPGVGFSATRRLAERGLRTLGDLWAARDDLRGEGDAALGAALSLSEGLDGSAVRRSGAPLSVSAEDSFWQAPLSDPAALEASARALSRKLLVKLRCDEARFGFRSPKALTFALRVHAKHGGGAGRTLRRAPWQLRIPPARRKRASRDLGLDGEDAGLADAMAEHFLAALAPSLPPAPYNLSILSLGLAFDHPDGMRGLAAVVVLAVVGTGLALVAFNRIIQKTNALFASTVTYIIPLFATMWGWLDDEPLTVLHLLGGMVVLVGVRLVSLGGKT